jgi:hypothetical protein
MKFMVKVTLPVEEGNAAIRDGSMMDKFQAIFDEVKPDAVYFAAENGQRTQYLIVDLDDPAKMPSMAEPWWLSFNADVSISPVFTLEDMEAIGPALGEVAQKWS